MAPRKQLSVSAFAQYLFECQYKGGEADYVAATAVSKLLYKANFRPKTTRLCAFLRKHKKDILKHLNTLKEVSSNYVKEKFYNHWLD